MSRPAELQLRLFGRASATWRGETLAFPTRKSLAIVCIAAIAGGTVPRSELAELLWERNRARAMRRELHRLRELPGAPRWLEADDGIRILAHSDYRSFVLAMRGGDPTAALDGYAGDDRALLLHGLEPRNAPAFAEWLAGERTRIEALARDGHRERGERLWLEGRTAEAATHYERATELDPLDEGAHRSLVRIELARGDLRAAQRRLDRYRQLLASELGVGPTRETDHLAREVQLATTASPSRSVPAPMPTALLRPPVLAGRASAWEALERAWERRLPAFVAGPAGIGKSRLLMDFAQAKTGGNYAVLRGRPGDDTLAYSTIARGIRIVAAAYPEFLHGASAGILKEMAHVVPDLIELRPDPIRSAADRACFRHAFSELLHRMAAYYDAFLADDMQFFDAASFHETGRSVLELYADPTGTAGRSLNAFRPEDMPAGFVEGVERMAADGTAVYIELLPLDDSEVRELVGSLDVDVSPAVVHGLRRHTGGNPLYVVETVRGLYESGRLRDPDALSGGIDVPTRIARILERRLGRVSTRARRMAEILAAAQQDATLDLVASVSGLDAMQAADVLGELERAQIACGLAFAHDLLYESVARATPSAVRALLHARIAAHLEQRHAEPGRIASHLRRSDDPERARPWFLRAAEASLARGAEDQARSWLECALESSAAGDPLRERAARIRDRLRRPGAT